MTTTPLNDLLPSFFDSAVVRLTGRGLLPVERSAILIALVNSVGESVLRRVRDAQTEMRYEKDIGEISTADRFSDEWMPRLEIVDGIEHSSGLDRALSELSLFLIESRMDSLLRSGDTAVVGIGRITSARSVHEIRPRTEEIFDRLANAFADSPVSRRSGWIRLRELFRNHDQLAVRRLAEEAQLIATFREPLSYNISLSESLAFKSDHRSPQDVDIKATTENRFQTEQPSDSPDRPQTSIAT